MKCYGIPLMRHHSIWFCTTAINQLQFISLKGQLSLGLVKAISFFDDQTCFLKMLMFLTENLIKFLLFLMMSSKFRSKFTGWWHQRTWSKGNRYADHRHLLRRKWSVWKHEYTITIHAALCSIEKKKNIEFVRSFAPSFVDMWRSRSKDAKNTKKVQLNLTVWLFGSYLRETKTN